MKWIMRKSSFLLFFICIASVKIYAQAAKVNGKVIDAASNETIPYASVQLIDKKSKTVIKFIQTDLDGLFSINQVKTGVYTFKVSYVGYQTLVRDSIKINTPNQVVALGTIRMKTGKGNVLNEVTVVGQKPTMQLGIDKKVFSVDQSIVSEGGSATDILQNVPSVQTDMDGNVSLRGSKGVRVLIDGKPSLIAGGDVAQILESIPASSIETVEVITNPSSKYDAEGQSGIINIVLKKNHKLGFNGNVSLGAGSYSNYNGSTSLSFQNKKVNLYGNYGYKNGNRLGGGYNNISYLNPNSYTQYTEQNTDMKRIFTGHNLKLGVEYYLKEKSIIGLTGGYNARSRGGAEFLSIGRYGAQSSIQELSSRKNAGEHGGGSYDLGLDFTQKFKKSGQELTFNTSWSAGDNENTQLLNTNIINPLNQPQKVQNTIRNGNNNNFNIQVDYTMPLGNAGKFEAGYRSQMRNSTSATTADSLNLNTNNYDFMYQLRNDFDSKDQVHAAYVNYQNQIKNFGYQIGLRAEDAQLDTKMGAYDAQKNISYTPGRVAYTRLYPSVFLTQKFKDDQQIQLNYSRRVNRPSHWDTNPFLDVSDPYNHRMGNVNLKPEDVHAFELSYSKYFKKFSLVSTAYLRQTNDLIQRLRTDPDANGITLSMPQNLTSSTNSGLELIGKFDPVKKWNFTANINLYQRSIKGVAQYGVLASDGFSYNANLTNNFILPYNITVQLRADYNSKEVMAQGISKAMYGVDAGAKMDFYNKKASVSLNVRDVFNTRKWQMQTQGNTTIADFAWFMKGQMASLTLSYRFGQSSSMLKKNKKNENESRGGDEEMF
jgi:outer membrane receptor protein involved in Fe transport